MKVFISWSGDTSKALATALRRWLGPMFEEVDFWISREIKPGQRWENELDKVLQTTGFGILCLEPSNLASTWVHYEAGALSKSIETARVIPYCLGLEPEDVPSPLGRFQGVIADEDGTRNLVEGLNSILKKKRDPAALRKTFAKRWPALRSQLEKIPAMNNRGPSIVKVSSILAASTAQFEDLGAAEDMAVLESNYPKCVTKIHNVRERALGDALTTHKFDIVHLMGYVEPKSGDFCFNKDERLSAMGLLKLLERAGVSLLFLATCDALTLGAIVSRSLSVIAASEDVFADKMVTWERSFYGLLSKGTTLATSYDLAQARLDLPMRILMRNDAVFVPTTTRPKKKTK